MNITPLDVEYAEYLEERACAWLEGAGLSNGEGGERSLWSKLTDMYVGETSRPADHLGSPSGGELLERLVTNEGLNHVTVNLHPGSEGFSVTLPAKEGHEAATPNIPYDDSEFLECLDQGTIPALILPLIDALQIPLFYDGCIIAQIRDYRQGGSQHPPSSRFILLRSSDQTMLQDCAALISESGRHWSPDQRLALEREIVKLEAPPLCLSPSPAAGLVLSRNAYRASCLSTPALHRMAKRHSQVSVCRRKRFMAYPAPRELRLHDFLQKRREQTTERTRSFKGAIDTWKKRSVLVTAPESVDVEKYARIINQPSLPYDNSLRTVEEYTYEADRSSGRLHYSHLRVMQRMSDQAYVGELYIDRDYSEGVRRGRACRFLLGHKSEVERYIRQFQEIVTEEGRKSVKITRSIPGQSSQVKFTPGAGILQGQQGSRQGGQGSRAAADKTSQQQATVKEEGVTSQRQPTMTSVPTSPANSKHLAQLPSYTQATSSLVVSGGRVQQPLPTHHVTMTSQAPRSQAPLQTLAHDAATVQPKIEDIKTEPREVTVVQTGSQPGTVVTPLPAQVSGAPQQQVLVGGASVQQLPAGVPLASLQNIQLAGIQGGIAVPVPLSMLNGQGGATINLLSAGHGFIVTTLASSLPSRGMTHSTVSLSRAGGPGTVRHVDPGTVSLSRAGGPGTLRHVDPGTLQARAVRGATRSIVTAAPTSQHLATVGSKGASGQQQGLMSVPINVATGGLTHFVAGNMPQSGAIRHVSLVQLGGQQLQVVTSQHQQLQGASQVVTTTGTGQLQTHRQVSVTRRPPSTGGT